MSRVLPILFNTDMVRAILDGRKTVTRRAVKSKQYMGLGEKGPLECLESVVHRYDNMSDADVIIMNYKPTYQPGDVIYIRETWDYVEGWKIGDPAVSGGYFYRADGDLRPVSWRSKWHPSIHMPKEAARIWLKVTDVRVERLQDITEEQAIKEGISRLYDDLSDAEYIDWAKRTGIYPKAKEDWGYKNYLWYGNFGISGNGNWKSDNWEYQYSSYDNAIGSFSSLWNSTLKKSDLARYGWDANPWVWVIEFEQCEKPEIL